ncbi:hypothetical protein HMPREF9104_03146 [Lentilactobacillus kisonensis F0435]|uniref:Uncharacterized protein n=1 Tax=Lentilactobacillus kisonensis F0435 TaxID=797516 RepID=H1LKJ2_9LACO|nr:hypothetical protein HMPREF9104_03146 [Lentilactobacillus kisonensis F0435]
MQLSAWCSTFPQCCQDTIPGSGIFAGGAYAQSFALCSNPIYKFQAQKSNLIN